ncbi:hypothetical protein [Leucobacter chromiiresistens]|uniref:Uncharacterized protein n=1 Tax=Leucobacter chromiiresistens TaxID=1079994 RepID=A0A1H1BCR2_9MICO|nr:hypothetical protein [Leucobacter chromiiresistens]SDQ49661.1 hypothetical protein SAMN04488565_2732 [Leucobacter chromiiresistens]
MTAITTMAAHTHDCPDCLSETRLVHLADNIHVVQILHDDTCPTYQRIEGD